jgi:hypothetical protein
VLNGDPKLKKWYNKFVDSAIRFYDNRFKTIKNLEKI